LYYHVRVQFALGRSSKIEEKFEVDLTREDLKEKIVRPFLDKRTFMCGGAFIDPKAVRELHFTETSQPSAELIPFIRAEHRASGIVFFGSDESFVAEKGHEVTRRIIEEEEATRNTIASRTAENHREGQLQSTRKVFVVHGHDVSALTQTEVLLLRWRLEPIILRDQPNAGLTVIEKIEANTDVGYAIVLLTPDDVCGADLAPRSRQNVVFEWGYLMAKLGRSRVLCLRKGDTETPSDLHGIVRIDFEGDVRDKTEQIRRELVAQGFTIEG
jgi:predicted nucleotide-binding protein